jgi:hypothetical protein
MTLLLFSCGSKSPKGKNGVTYRSAIEYNDYIVNRQTSLMEDLVNFVQSAQNDLDSAEVMLDRNVRTTEKMIVELKGMPAYKGDSSFRDAAIRTFAFYRDIFDKDYRQIIRIRLREDGLSAEADREIEDIVTKIEKEEKGIDDRFQSAQRNFARNNDVLLIDNKKQRDLEKQLETRDE